MHILHVAAQESPDFTFTDLDGKTWNLYDQLSQGKTVLLDFFFADCRPCQEYTPLVEEIWKDFGADSGSVVVIGISDRDDNKRLEEFNEGLGVTYLSTGIKGGGDTITDLFKLWFPFVGWPKYAVVCPNRHIAWNINKLDSMRSIRDSIGACQNTAGEFILESPVNTIYPNPVYIELHLPEIAGVRSVKIYSMNGILQRQFDPDELLSNGIKLEFLSPGAYLVRIEGASTVQNIKIIKK